MKTLPRRQTMRLAKTPVLAAWALGLATVLAGTPGQTRIPLAGEQSTADQEVTGEHRGYTNDHLFVRVSDDKEMTFVVRIPGDTEEKWHKDFQMLSRITVTYHQGPDDKLPVATAIRAPK
jgi:hypothetical protein